MGYRQSSWVMSAGRWTTEPRRLAAQRRHLSTCRWSKESGGSTIQHGVAAVSRRAVIRAALGTWLGAHVRCHGGHASAQTQSATPSAGQGGRNSDRDRLTRRHHAGERCRRPLRRRRRVAARFDSFDQARVSGISIRARFAQDPQIPLSYLEPLVRPDPATMRPTPWLAQRWEWRADGLELVFLLRDGVVWHDGVPLTAADAAFTFEVYRSDTDSVVSGLFALVESVDRSPIESFAFGSPLATLTGFSMLQPCRSSPESSTASSGRGCRRQDGHCRLSTGRARCRSAPDPGGSPSGTTRRSGSPGSTGTGARAWLDQLEIAVMDGPRARLEAWQDGDSQVIWPVRVRELRNWVKLPARSIPCQPHR